MTSNRGRGSEPVQGRLAHILGAALATLGLSGGAAMAACAPLPNAMKYDAKVRQGATCAFDRAAENDRGGVYKGGKAVDIGGGFVGQKLTFDPTGCDRIETLVVLDCTAGRMAAFSGTTNPVFTGGPIPVGPVNTRVRNLQPPYGPVALRASMVLDDLIAKARSYSIGVGRTPEGLFVGKRARNRFDVFCGCGVFYPGSQGAAG